MASQCDAGLGTPHCALNPVRSGQRAQASGAGWSPCLGTPRPRLAQLWEAYWTLRWLQRACLGFSAPFVQQRALKPTRAHPSRRWLRLLQALPRSGAAAGVAAQPSGQPSMWRAWSAVPAWQRLGRWRPSGLALWTLPCRAQCSGSATAPHALRRSEAHSCGWQALPPPLPPLAPTPYQTASLV